MDIEVTIISAKGLRNADDGWLTGKSDPYCICSLARMLWQRFQCHPHTLHLRNRFFQLKCWCSISGRVSGLLSHSDRTDVFEVRTFVWWERSCGICRTKFRTRSLRDTLNPNWNFTSVLKLVTWRLVSTSFVSVKLLRFRIVSNPDCWGHTEAPGVWSLGWRFGFSRWFSRQSYLSLQKARFFGCFHVAKKRLCFFRALM